MADSREIVRRLTSDGWIMQYPIVIHKERKNDYGVTVPDLPGCFSAGSTMDEAMAMAKEAIELHVEGLIEEGMAIPDASKVEQLQRNSNYANGVWAIIEVDSTHLRTRARRVNITLPERVLDSIDRYAATAGETRSGLLVKAATTYIASRTSARPDA
jgi:predicted RNase H-like HicB family nuclease